MWTDEAGYNFPPELFRKGEELIGPLASVSCTSASLCVASLDSNDEFNELTTSVDPLGGKAAWTLVNHVVGARNVRPPYDGDPITGVSCASLTLCVAVDDAGNVMTSSEPGNGEGVWTIFPADANSLRGVTCPSTSLCVAVDSAGNIVSSTNPTGGNSAWTSTPVNVGIPLTGVSCVSQSLCVAVDAKGDVLTSTEPAGGAGGWAIASVDAGHAFTSVSCSPDGLCTAVDDAGYAVTAMLSSHAEGHVEVPSGTSGTLPPMPPTSVTSTYELLGIKIGYDGQIVVTLKTSGAGSLNVVGRATIGGIAARARDKTNNKSRRSIIYGMGAASTLGTHIVTVPITPSTPALAALRRLRALRVVLDLTFRPQHGTSVVTKRTVFVRYRRRLRNKPKLRY
jgi:hypothetical protein